MDQPEKYQISKWTLFVDNFMSKFITVGGLSVIAAVLLILIFIGKEVVPLLEEAKVAPIETIDLPKVDIEHVAVDEWTALPAFITKNSVYLLDREKNNEISKQEFKLNNNSPITAINYDQERQLVVLGNAQGHISLVDFSYTKDFLDEYEKGRQKSKTIFSMSQKPYLELAEDGAKIIKIAANQSESKKIVAAVTEKEGKQQLLVVTLKQSVDLFGNVSDDLAVDEKLDFSKHITGKIKEIIISSQADSILAYTDKNEVFSFRTKNGKIGFSQKFEPFKEEENKEIASMNYLFGSSTVIFSNKAGRILGFSIFKPSADMPRVFGLTKTTLDNLEGGAEVFSRSLRNKSFLVSNGKNIKLMYSTSESVNWQDTLEYEVKHSIISGKYDRILLVDDKNKLNILKLSDPHPEASVKTYFTKVWYEGQPEPKYLWSSTGGTEEAEKQLSMMPLIFGTLKATFYAMLFAMPIAILAAIYTSQFLPPSWKTIIKPLMEVMASLPSVIIGFLAALILAPVIEDKVPSIMLVVLSVPTAALVMGTVWSKLPPKLRYKCSEGMEFVFFAPILILVTIIAWNMGPVIESWFFTIVDSQGREIASFSRWWSESLGYEYTQKNAMIVGFAMGFAVIPIIFTIAEDSLSNVPKSLTSASLALGASRWQTTWRVVLPTASAGIFSACMIGLGRAVGETMIVLCAAGGTGLMEMNIFNGMRTLSLNLATELPEAAKQGTLYRTLFLGALILFVLTFVINTVAEIIRQHIRNKYKTV
ncbi:MAG: ABC transporter permease subunit [Lentisphaeraceae bacterium]|nr:ABC transporter permease subunit [Lentisphaeraceae bacterium]